MLNRLMSTSNDVTLTILRLVLGVVFLAHGSQKMLGWFGGFGFHGTMGFFTHMGMPAPVAFLIISTEFFGGLGLIVGLLTRIAALGITGLMIGAIFMVHLANGFFMNWMGTQKGEGFEYHLLVIAMAATLLLRGAGAFSFGPGAVELNLEAGKVRNLQLPGRARPEQPRVAVVNLNLGRASALSHTLARSSQAS